MIRNTYNILFLIVLTVIFNGTTTSVIAQDKDKKDSKTEVDDVKSIGGKEHNAEILGVKLGMDVSAALQSVFINANRKAGQEKPDAKKSEGKDGKDIRVLYKGLPQGDLQIVFTQGKFVKEVTLLYKKVLRYSDLRLPYSGFIGEALDGERFDDRYTIGYTDAQKVQGLYWRDESVGNYKTRVLFTTASRLKEPATAFQTIVQKTLIVTPGYEDNFMKTMELGK
jgi:hypothetical protein